MTHTKEEYQELLETLEYHHEINGKSQCEWFIRDYFDLLKSALKLAIDLQPRPIEECPDDNMPVLLLWKNYMKKFVYDNHEIPDFEMKVGPYCINGSGGAKSWHGDATHFYDLSALPKPEVKE